MRVNQVLYSVAIIKRPPTDTMPPGVEELVYGPVTIMGERHDDVGTIANRVIAQASSEGKLPEGWSSRHYVAGLSYSHFT
jgi:hypothetical protein